TQPKPPAASIPEERLRLSPSTPHSRDVGLGEGTGFPPHTLSSRKLDQLRGRKQCGSRHRYGVGSFLMSHDWPWSEKTEGRSSQMALASNFARGVMFPDCLRLLDVRKMLQTSNLGVRGSNPFRRAKLVKRTHHDASARNRRRSRRHAYS